MKIIRFALIVAFVFTCAVSSVQAKAGERDVFIPLVTQADPNIPVWVQADQAYNRYLPQLVVAKHKGQILDFRMEPGVGLLVVKYAAGAPSLTFLAQQEISEIGAALAQVPQESSNLPIPEGTGTVFGVWLYSSCFYSWNMPKQGYVSAILYDSKGTQLGVSAARQATTTYSGGCFYPSGNIEPGHKIVYKIYDKTATILLGTYTSIIPELGINTINKADGSIGGSGPAGKPYYASWYHWAVDPNHATESFSYTGTIGSDRKWTANMSDTTSIRGGDYLLVETAQTPRFFFRRYRYAPRIYCIASEGYCGGFAEPFQTVNATIAHAGKLYSVQTKAGADGRFTIDLFDYSSHHTIILQPGDKISVAGVGVYKLPNLTADINYTTDVISGVMPKDSYARLYLLVYPLRQQIVYTGWWVASVPSKNFYVQDATSTVNLKLSDTIIVELDYIDPETGNAVVMLFPFGP